MPLAGSPDTASSELTLSANTMSRVFDVGGARRCAKQRQRFTSKNLFFHGVTQLARRPPYGESVTCVPAGAA